MKKLLFLLCCTCCIMSMQAQSWTEPEIPGKDLSEISSSEIVYVCNVETDAFLLNGMDWNTNACATRLTNGDKVVSIPQQCYAHVSNGQVRIQLTSFPDFSISCLNADANSIYVDQNTGQYFTYTETKAGSHIYTLNNTTYKKDLDVSWDYGGHLTLTGGAGHTKWAFIPETQITNGAYALYKVKKQLYDVYKAVYNAGKANYYSAELAAAHSAYTAVNATESSIISAARTLFNATHADIDGPLNVSFLFDTPDMAGAAYTTDWSVNGHGIAWGEFEVYHNALTLQQTKTVPQGLYEVVFHALYRQDGGDAAPYISVETGGTVTAEVPNMSTLDYKTNANNNNWAAGPSYSQPNGMQSCAQALTHTDAVARAKDVVMMETGEMTITAQISSNSQWFNWQGFEIYYNGVGNSASKGELILNIEKAELLYGNGSWQGASALKTALDNAKEVYADANATMQELVNANDALVAAIEDRLNAASTSQPFDWSSLINNPSFENGFSGWEHSGFALQGNTAFTLTDGNTYIEKWVGAGGAVGDASVKQTVNNLGVGVYVVKLSAQNIQQENAATQNNAWLTANDKRVQVSSTNEYSLTFTCIENTATIGFEAIGATGNWLACDNFKLYYTGGETSDFNTALQAYINDAKGYVGEKMQTPVLNTLNAAISAAEDELARNATSNYPDVATSLRLAQKEAILSIAAYDSIAIYIEEAETRYGNGSGKGAADLKVVLDATKVVYADNNATMQELIDAKETLKTAIAVYRKTSANVNQPLDWTSLIVNPSFENGFNGWVQNELFLQGNTAFTLKDGNTYVEKWVGAGGSVGNGAVMQTINNLEMGVYMLKVAAQNIQEGSSARQTNAWITANADLLEVNTSKEYTLLFTHIEKDAIIGFKAIGATGNWLALDNFRLYYAGGETSDYNEALQTYINDAKSYLGEKMQTPALNTLNATISAAEAELQNNAVANYPTVSTPLRIAKEEAIVSIAAFASLQAAIDEAVGFYGTGNQNGADKLLAAINQAKAVNNNLNSTIAQMETEENNLEDAMLQYRLDNATGATPTVTTDTRFVRGSDLILGRMTYSGVSESNILEAGFCWSTQPNPTVLDYRSTAYIDYNGRIYMLEGLQPATVYYIRAYVMTKTYTVGYGETMKVITIPRGECGYWYNWGADAEANERINNALADAINYYNRFTSMKGFHVSCSFGSGTPTADCGYGGGMRVGPNASYQRTGTILHEMAHGVGVGTHYMWYGYTPLRENGWNGLWMGERANKVLQFFYNDYTSMMTGDATHMWPFGINGAHEDYGNWVDYMINAMIIQGMGEDGLPPTNGFATPAYTLRSDEGVKYYIKNENEGYGLTTAYLTETNTGTLKWVEKSTEEVLTDDAYAWYVDFVPATCYYRIRNAKSGKYFTYSSNIIQTTSKTVPGETEDFQLMGGRVRATIGGSYTAQGFWIAVPHANMSPPTLEATANGNVATYGLNLENSATAQRWIFLSEEEMGTVENALQDAYSEDLSDLLAEIRKLLTVPHTQKTGTADNDLSATLADIEERCQSATSSSVVTQLIEEAKTAAKTFLANAVPTRQDAPFNITFFLVNPSIEHNSGWSESPYVYSSCGEFFERSFDMYQTLINMPAGTYELTAQAFQRPGDYTTAYNDYSAGRNNVNTALYINGYQNNVRHITAEATTTSLHSGDIGVGSPTVYFPNNMEAAAAHFAAGKYQNDVEGTLSSTGNLTVGIKSAQNGGAYWSIFDNFNLYYHGSSDLLLYETATVSPTINAHFEEVTLQRAIKADTWSTFVVPFDIPASSLTDWEVKELVRTELNHDVISLIFADVKDGIKSGVPYMVRNGSAVNEITMNNATVNTTLKNTETEHVIFTGAYHKGYVPEGAYFISSNKFYRAADNTNTMKGYRAYLMPKAQAANVKAMDFIFDDNETNINDTKQSATVVGIYNTEGVRLHEMQRGLNIVQMSDGTTKKVFVK